MTVSPIFGGVLNDTYFGWTSIHYHSNDFNKHIMKIYDALIDLLNKDHSVVQPAPEGICPNCWGRIEYGGQFYDAVRNNKVDVNSKNPNVGWVQEYADKHLVPIQLQPQGSEYICQKCKVTYKAS